MTLHAGSGLLVADDPALWPPERPFPGCAANLYIRLGWSLESVRRFVDQVDTAHQFTHVAILHTSTGVEVPSGVFYVAPAVGYWSDVPLVMGARFTTPSDLADWSAGMSCIPAYDGLSTPCGQTGLAPG